MSVRHRERERETKRFRLTELGPSDYVAPLRADRNTNRENEFEESILLAGGTAWSCFRLTELDPSDSVVLVGPERKQIAKINMEKSGLARWEDCVELAEADGGAPSESVVPGGAGQKKNECKSEKAVLLAGRTVWSWPRLVGMHQVNLWSRWGQTEK